VGSVGSAGAVGSVNFELETLNFELFAAAGTVVPSHSA
jgi:hypothetical protein